MSCLIDKISYNGDLCFTGMRFAKVQSMLGTAAFFKHFKVEPSPKTKRELEFDPKGIVLITRDGIWVKISKR